MSEQTPYEQLGVSEEASFDEIQEARNRLVAQVSDDRKQVERIEAAYDAVLMHRLKMRQEGKIKVPERIRFPERLTSETLQPKPKQPAKLPLWITNSLDTPTSSEIGWAAAIFGGLAIVALLYPSGNPIIVLQLVLVTAIASSIYFLNRKEGRFGRAFLLSFCSLLLGMLLGSVVGSLLNPVLQQFGLEVQTIATVMTLLIMWSTTSFLR
jgi:hypothetical protein